MRTIHRLSIALLITGGALFAAAPAPTTVWNPASYTPAGFPNSGIAQGSIFVVYGANLGPTTIAQAPSLPLPTTAGVGGTSITITVPAIGGTTVTAPMIYSLATQVVGVLPSNTPIGTGTLTVTFNGGSGSIPITVVASNFGISTVDQTGAGPAVVTFPNYSPITTTNTAAVGDTLLLWGTGLGPLPAGQSDATAPNVVDLGTPVQVFLGGVSAVITYRGRSGDPGLDQINFVVPAGVSGCYVSLVVQTGTTVSNTTTMAIGPNDHGPCSDADGAPLSSPTLSAALSSKGTLSLGTVSLTSFSFSINESGQNFSQSTYSGSASFNRFTAAQLTTSTSLFGIPSVGSCSVANFTGTSPPGVTPALALGLNAGKAITVTPPSAGAVSLTESGGVTGVYTSPPSGTTGGFSALPAGTYTVSGAGGVDVGAFSLNIPVQTPLTWTNETAITTAPTTGLPGTVVRANPLKLTWTGGDPNGFAVILGFSASGTGPSALGGVFFCIAPIAPGSFTVPAPALLALPPTPSNAIAILGVGSTAAPIIFNATGLDYGAATVLNLSGANLLYQ
jgi:uncharacterized protein (TIGR03437 family)